MKQLDHVEKTGTGYRITLKRPYRAVFGFGEKFDSCDQKGKLVRACVRERCFYQGDYTYLSMPFFLTPDGFGLYVETYTEVDFDLRREGEITVEFPVGSRGEEAKVWLLEGSPKEIISEFRSLAGMPRVFPKWVLGAWMSSTGHKENISQEGMTRIGVGFYYQADSQYGYYWIWAGCQSSYQLLLWSRGERNCC